MSARVVSSTVSLLKKGGVSFSVSPALSLELAGVLSLLPLGLDKTRLVHLSQSCIKLHTQINDFFVFFHYCKSASLAILKQDICIHLGVLPFIFFRVLLKTKKLSWPLRVRLNGSSLYKQSRTY